MRLPGRAGRPMPTLRGTDDMGKKLLTVFVFCVALLTLAACGEQGKIDGVKKTVIPNCQGKLEVFSGS